MRNDRFFESSWWIRTDLGLSSFCMLGAMNDQSKGMKIASKIMLAILIGILLMLIYVLVRVFVLG